jgi:threonine dehydrogenase-like Zn-dependent dehydrogenase
MGHEAIGFVEAVGAEVRTLKKGVLVVMPFAFGATDMVGERGEEGAERVRELTGGLGVGSVLECVGTDQPMVTAMGIARPGGAVGRVGVPHYETTDAWVTGF